MTRRDVNDAEANLDDLIEGYFNDARLLTTQVVQDRGKRIGQLEGYDGRLFDWLTEMLNFGPADGPERSWAVILALIERAPDAQTLMFIGSGALEHLIRKAGSEFESRIVALAVDPRFRVALSAVWPDESVPQTLVASIEAARQQATQET
jgi:hypothetical protein